MIILLAILNLFLVLGMAPLFEGFVRKYIRARVAHSRRGPPVIQPFYDLLKLLGKEDLEVSQDFLYRFAPILCLGATLTCALLAPLGAQPPLNNGSDVIVFVYFVGLAAVALVMAGMTSESPYAYVGATREMMMMLIVEPVLVIVLIAAAINAHSLRFADIIVWHISHGPSFSMVLGAFALFLALQAQFGKLPFDIPEAEQEVIGGPFIELSGPKLALVKWSTLARQFIFAAVLVTVFLPWPGKLMLALAPGVLSTIIKVFIVTVIIGLIDVLNPRLRIDQALAYYFGAILVALVAVILAFFAA